MAAISTERPSLRKTTQDSHGCPHLPPGVAATEFLVGTTRPRPQRHWPGCSPTRPRLAPENTARHRANLPALPNRCLPTGHCRSPVRARPTSRRCQRTLQGVMTSPVCAGWAWDDTVTAPVFRRPAGRSTEDVVAHRPVSPPSLCRTPPSRRRRRAWSGPTPTSTTRGRWWRRRCQADGTVATPVETGNELMQRGQSREGEAGQCPV